jgi:hypothetical protein
VIYTQVPKLPQPKASARPKNSTDTVTTMRAAALSQDRIPQRADGLYESRGREPGHDKRDWFCAEQEIVNGRINGPHRLPSAHRLEG